jgi:hypothetical protein
LFPTIAILAGLASPPQVDGVDLSPLFSNPAAAGISSAAFSQQARCYSKDSPTPNPTPTQQLLTAMMTCEFVERGAMDFMGYSMRTVDWRYTEWVKWNGTALRPEWNHNVGVELYDHRPNVTAHHPIWSENVNMATDPTYAGVAANLAVHLHAHFEAMMLKRL